MSDPSSNRSSANPSNPSSNASTPSAPNSNGLDSSAWAKLAGDKRFETLVNGLEKVAILKAKREVFDQNPPKQTKVRRKYMLDLDEDPWNKLSEVEQSSAIDEAFSEVLNSFAKGMSELHMPSERDDEYNILGAERNKIRSLAAHAGTSLAQDAMSAGGPTHVSHSKGREWDWVDGSAKGKEEIEATLLSVVAWAGEIPTQQALAEVASVCPSGWGEKLSRVWGALDRPDPNTTKRQAWITGDKTPVETDYRDVTGQKRKITIKSAMRKPTEFDTLETAPTPQIVVVKQALSANPSSTGIRQRFGSLFGTDPSARFTNSNISSASLAPPLNNGRGFTPTVPEADLASSAWNRPYVDQSVLSGQTTGPSHNDVGVNPSIVQSSPISNYSGGNVTSLPSGWGVPDGSGIAPYTQPSTPPSNGYTLDSAPPITSAPYSGVNTGFNASGWNRPAIDLNSVDTANATRQGSYSASHVPWPVPPPTSFAQSSTPYSPAPTSLNSNPYSGGYAQPVQSGRNVRFANPQSCASEVGSSFGSGFNMGRVGST